MSSAQATRFTAILTMVAAMACLSTQDTLSKKLMLSVAPVIIIWTRYGLQTALACATMSLSVLPGVSLLATKSSPMSATSAKGVKLLTGS